MDNYVQLEGNLTRDVELKYTATGTAIGKFSLAVTRRWFNQGSNDRQEETSFFDVEAWKDLAEHAADSLKKGDRAVVIGRLKQSTWEAEDGTKRSRVIVVADSVNVSLRWATAESTKATSGSSNGKEPAMAGAPAGSDEFADEEPF